MEKEEADRRILERSTQLRARLRHYLQGTTKGANIDVIAGPQDGLQPIIASGSALVPLPLLIDERLELQEHLVQVEELITEFQAEIARLQEDHCSDCPRTQEMITQESRIARAKLRLLAQERLKEELVEELELLQSSQ